MKKIYPLILLLSTTGSAISQSLSIQKLAWLEGKWQCKEKPTLYEEWKLSGSSLSGYGYHVENGNKTETEKLLITEINQRLVYRVTLFKPQKKIDFDLKNSVNKWVFTNEKNDFPQVIIYQKISNKKCKVLLTMIEPQSSKMEEMTFVKVSSKSWKFE